MSPSLAAPVDGKSCEMGVAAGVRGSKAVQVMAMPTALAGGELYYLRFGLLSSLLTFSCLR